MSQLTFTDLHGLEGLALEKADFWNGIYCGYRECCVLFYCHGWDIIHDFLYNTPPITVNKLLWGKIDIDHVECPECIINRVTHNQYS